jgi:hypothetical protein
MTLIGVVWIMMLMMGAAVRVAGSGKRIVWNVYLSANE